MCTANQRICLGCSSNLLTLLRRSAAAAARRCARRRRTLQGRPWPNSAVLLTVVLVVYYKYNDPGLELQLYTTSTIHTI